MATSESLCDKASVISPIFYTVNRMQYMKNHGDVAALFSQFTVCSICNDTEKIVVFEENRHFSLLSIKKLDFYPLHLLYYIKRKIFRRFYDKYKRYKKKQRNQ